MKLHCRIYRSGYLEELYQPPIIFLHGMGLNGNVFKKVAPIISKNTKRKAYVPDARNHGKSPWVQQGMSYDVLTDDLLEFMRQFNMSKAILIGSSMGGRIAMNFSLKYPEKVDALIVEDMTPRNVPSSGTNVVRHMIEHIRGFLDSISPDTDLNEAKTNLANLVIEAMPQYVDKERALPNIDPDFVPLVKEGNSIKLECNADIIAGMIENDALVQNLPNLNVSYNGDALFIYGSKGFFNLDEDSSVKKLFPRSIIKRIEGASHLSHIDSPEEYTSIITNFILNRKSSQSKY